MANKTILINGYLGPGQEKEFDCGIVTLMIERLSGTWTLFCKKSDGTWIPTTHNTHFSLPPLPHGYKGIKIKANSDSEINYVYHT
jgi:hypothetical protein